MTDPTGKEERFRRVCEAVLATLLRGGPDALAVSTLARKAGVSRAWIYKYVGADQDALLEAAAHVVGDAFIDRDRSYTSDGTSWAEATATSDSNDRNNDTTSPGRHLHPRHGDGCVSLSTSMVYGDARRVGRVGR